MKFFERLFGKRPNPTLLWGAFSPPIPDFDLNQMAFGSLRFGDTLEAASFLGRPESLEWTQGKYCCLLYAAGGFQLDFDDGRFAYLAFFIGPDKLQPKHPALEFSQPRLRGGTHDGIRLSRETDRAMLERVCGVADSFETEPQETIYYYSRQGFTTEFEMEGETGRLKRWNLFPD